MGIPSVNVADEFIQRMNAQNIAFQGVGMTFSRKEGLHHSVSSKLKDRSCWVRMCNIHPTVIDSVLKQFLKKNGSRKCKQIQLIHHYSNGTKPGFAYLECTNAQSATAMVHKLRGKELKEQKVWMEWIEDRDEWISKRKMISPPKKKSHRVIEIANLHCTVGEEEIGKMIEVYCELTT